MTIILLTKLILKAYQVSVLPRENQSMGEVEFKVKIWSLVMIKLLELRW